MNNFFMIPYFLPLTNKTINLIFLIIDIVCVIKKVHKEEEIEKNSFSIFLSQSPSIVVTY